MKRWLHYLDKILRGEATRIEAFEKQGIEVPLGGLLLLILLMAAAYGACMGFFAGFRDGGPSYMQWLAAVVKVPTLFVLTIAVTFPSLYVFNALVGSRLSLRNLLQLLIVALAVNVAVLASMGPIVAFFSVSTTSYPFVLLLNMLIFLVSAALGLAFLKQTLNRWNAAQPMIAPPTPEADLLTAAEVQGAPSCPADQALSSESGDKWSHSKLLQNNSLDRNIKTVFRCWMVTVVLVGAQMAWVLRPILGKPSEPFHWFSAREASFFHAIGDAISHLFS